MMPRSAPNWHSSGRGGCHALPVHEPHRPAERAWTTLRRGTVVACLAVAAGLAVLLLTMAHWPGAGQPHGVSVVISAPAVVAAGLAEEANAMPGGDVDTTWVDDADQAEQDVRDGTVQAAVLVDLRETEDVVVVGAWADPDLNRAVVDRIEAVERSHHRTVHVVERDQDWSDGAARVRLVTLVSALMGFLYVVAVSLLRGPWAASLGRGVARVLGLAGVAVGTAVALSVVPVTSLPGDRIGVIAIAAATCVVVGLVTLAIEALAGLVGLAIASAVMFALATPLIGGTDAHLLPAPWPTLGGLTTTGSAQAALSAVAFHGGHDVWRTVAPLAILGVVALVALLFARALQSDARRTADATGRPALPVAHWRARVGAVVGPLAVLMFAGVLVLPSGVASSPSVPSVASETECIADDLPHDLGEINQMLLRLDSPKTPFAGGDVGADAELQDGRRLFVFGDSVRGVDYDGPRFVRNSMLMLDDDCLSVVMPASKGALVPDRPDGVGYWPMSVVAASRPGYDLVAVTLQRIDATGPGSFDFANLGPSLAVFVVPVGETPQLLGRGDIGPDLDDRSRPMWGAATAVAGGWVYLYGTANPDQQGVFGYSLSVARVRPDDLLDQSAWRYWDGSAWQGHAAKAAELIPAVDGVSQTLSVFHQGKRWYAFSKRNDFLGSDVLFWTAPGPTGPFTPTDPVAELPSGSSGRLVYMPLAHPGLMPKKGTMVASYSRNDSDTDKVLDDPSLYRPQFLRVPLPD